LALHSLLVFLHVLSISVWLGAALWVAGDVSRALGFGRPHVDVLSAQLRPKLGLDAAAGVAVIVSGVLLMWEEQLGKPRLGLIIGIVATLVRLGVLAALRRAWKAIAERLANGTPVAREDPAARRMAMFSGIAHAMWLVALAGMVFPV
jgi:hypothetical protein